MKDYHLKYKAWLSFGYASGAADMLALLDWHHIVKHIESQK